MYEDIKKILREVIGAEDRCSNNAFASAGVCIDTPITGEDEVLSTLQRAFGGYSYYDLNQMGKKVQFLMYSEKKSTSEERISNDTFGEMYGEERFDKISRTADERTVQMLRELWDVNVLPFKPTVAKVLGYIKGHGPIGSYFIRVPRHLLVAHKSSGGELSVVDTEAKFASGRQVQALYFVDHDPSEPLKEWTEQNPEKSEKIMKEY